MATQAQINVNVKVDDKQVNTAVKSTENLRKEIKKLEVELTKVEIGSKQFQDLSEQLKDNRDKLELVRAKSRDLFDNFSMLPGPIGQIGSSISSTTDKLKIFSSFNLQDVKTQLSALKDDVLLVAQNFGKATGITAIFEKTSALLEKGLTKVGVSAENAGKAARGFGLAFTAIGIGAIIFGIYKLVEAFNSLSEEQQLNNQLAEQSAQIAGKQISVLTQLDSLLKRTTLTDAQKDEAVKSYNTTLGETLGKVDNWIELEKKLIGRLPEYKAYLLKRAEAEATSMLITKAITDKIQTEMTDPASMAGFYDVWSEGGILGFFIEGKKGIGENIQKRALTKFDKTIAGLQERLLKTNEEIAAQQKQLGLEEPTEPPKKTPAQTEAERKQKEFEEAQAEARIQLIKDSANTEEKELRNALQTQYDIRNKGKILSTEILTAQKNEIDRIVKEELEKDKEARKKGFDDRIKAIVDAGKNELSAIENDIEEKKLKYSEDSKEYRDALLKKFETQKELLNAEEAILLEKQKTQDGLTQEELNRLKTIGNERTALTNLVVKTNNEQVKSDRETALKKLDDAKKIRDEKFGTDMEIYRNDFQAQQDFLEKKLLADEEYFNTLEILYKGNQEKLDEIDRMRLANKQQFLKTEEDIRKAQVNLYIQAADKIIEVVGAETAAGKAALLVKQYILAKELVLEVKKTIAFSKQSLARSKVAVAEGASNTAKVGFPQNIPLLLLYAAQAAGIIKTVIDAVGLAKQTEGGDVGIGGVPDMQRPRKLAYGGLVTGPGGGKSDLIPAMLSNGESVINAESTAMFRPLLSAMNVVGGGRAFADGGLAVSNLANDNTLSQLQSMMMTPITPIKTYVVASDMTTQQMMDRSIKNRSTL